MAIIQHESGGFLPLESRVQRWLTDVGRRHTGRASLFRERHRVFHETDQQVHLHECVPRSTSCLTSIFTSAFSVRQRRSRAVRRTQRVRRLLAFTARADAFPAGFAVSCDGRRSRTPRSSTRPTGRRRYGARSTCRRTSTWRCACRCAGSSSGPSSSSLVGFYFVADELRPLVGRRTRKAGLRKACR